VKGANLRKKAKGFRLLWVIAVVAAILIVHSAGTAAEKKVVVGGKNFTEQYVLAELARILLERNGFEVVLKTGVGSVIARRSLENAQIDLYYEYTGTAYSVYYKQKDQKVMREPERCYQWVREADARKGLIWLDPIEFNNTYSLIMKSDESKALRIASIDDLADYVRQDPEKLIFAVNSEFWERPDGFKRLMRVYDFRVPITNVKKMETGLTYKALRDGKIDIAMAFRTDGRIAAFGFVNLIDDKKFFPVYNPAPVLRKAIYDRYPEIGTILSALTEKLTTAEIQRLNAAVDIEHKDVHKVALSWLKEKGII
jgi:osmoprotectant transport system substrate-binding protein